MRTHKSLRSWQEASQLSREVIRLSQSSWKPGLRAVFDQIQRSSISVQLNIAEGYALGNTGSFRRHLEIAYGSAVETSELLEILIDLEIAPEVASRVRERCQLAERLLLGLIRKLKR